MEPSNRAILKFNVAGGGVAQLSIPRANMAKTAASAEASMNALIANGAVVVRDSGAPQSIRSAELVSTTRTPIIPV